MGTIASPVNGASFYHGRTIPVAYRSDTVNFGCITLSRICAVTYNLNGTLIANLVPISQVGAAPQTQAAQNITLPSSGATATVDVEGWGVGQIGHDFAPGHIELEEILQPHHDRPQLFKLNHHGQLNDTAQAIYNLVAVPVATCNPATVITETTATLNGNIAGTLLAGGSARFIWGSPSPATNAAIAYVAGAAFVNLTGLTPGTTYAYRIEVLDDQGTVIASSGQCSFATNAGSGGGTGGGGNTAQLVKLCSITGVTLLRDCDTNEPILLVHVATADGDVIPVTSTEFPAGAGAGVFSVMGYYRSYYASTAGAYLSTQPTSICLPSSAGKIEIVCRCDDTDGDGVGEVSYKEIVKIDDAGTVTVLATYNRTMTAVYTPISPIDCSVPGDNLIAVEPHYKVLTGAQTWSVAADATLPVTSVTVMVVAIGNVATPPTVTDAGGTHPLFSGQSVSWSAIYSRDVAGLRSPLVFTCTAGSTLAVAWTEEVI